MKLGKELKVCGIYGIKNPTYKKHNIYAACSGEKPAIYGVYMKKSIKK